MTDPTPAMVAVPVELLKAAIEDLQLMHLASTVDSLAALLPKPTPRLVAVDLDAFFGGQFDDANAVDEFLKSQPDLLTLLDEAVEEVMDVTDWPKVRAALKPRIRAALGVTE